LWMWRSNAGNNGPAKKRSWKGQGRMPKKYYEREDVITDAAQIAERLKDTSVTLTKLMKEYRCGWSVIMRAVLSQMSKNQWKRIRKRKLRHGNAKHHFQKGHKPWNKCRKGIHLSPDTEFKKGHLPVQHKHVGTIRIVTLERQGKINQYREIKVSGIMQGRHKWIPYARYLYEQKYGPIPKGHFPVHRDGNSMNDDIDNLQVVDRGGHLALQMQRDPNMLKKCRRNASKALRKKWAAYRRRKAKLLKISHKTHERVRRTEQKTRERVRRTEQKTREHIRRSANEEAQYKEKFEKEIKNIRGAYTIWWECTGCGFESFLNNPPLPCPKCGGLNYEQIRQNREPARAVSIGLTASAADAICR